MRIHQVTESILIESSAGYSRILSICFHVCKRSNVPEEAGILRFNLITFPHFILRILILAYLLGQGQVARHIIRHLSARFFYAIQTVKLGSGKDELISISRVGGTDDIGFGRHVRRCQSDDVSNTSFCLYIGSVVSGELGFPDTFIGSRVVFV